MITLKTTLAELNPSISRMREGKELKVAVSFGND
jgi:hypothetical protein